MDTSVLDFPALLLATFIAVAIATGLLRAFKGENTRRAWIVAGILAAALPGWPLVFVTAFALLFGGLLIGATFFPRLLAF